MTGLLDNADVFGLRSVTDPVTSHSPLLSPVPLFVSDGAQDVLARFTSEGFEVTRVDVIFDRPFGFLAVHRPNRLAVVAGWVYSPFRTELAG